MKIVSYNHQMVFYNYFVCNILHKKSRGKLLQENSARLRKSQGKILKTFRMFYGYIWYSKLHNFRKNQRIMGILEPITETFTKFYSLIWYSKLHSFSFLQKQRWAFWNLQGFHIILADKTRCINKLRKFS